MTSPTSLEPGSAPGDADDLAGFRPSTARVLVRARRWLLGLATLLLLVPVGAWLGDHDGSGGRHERAERGTDQEELRSQAVMMVLSAACGENSRCGSGFVLVIDDEALVVTNRHVVEGACSTIVRPLDGGVEVPVSEIRLATDLDVAVLVLDEEASRSPLVVGDDDVLLGQPIRVVGFPGAEPSVLAGHVQRIEPTRLLLAIRADHGASGSPVIDAAGEVIGQLYARLEEECCVAMPIADVVVAAREAETVARCP